MICNACGVDGPSYTDLAGEHAANGHGHTGGKTVKRCAQCNSVRQAIVSSPSPSLAVQAVTAGATKVEHRAAPAHTSAGTDSRSIVALMQQRLTELDGIIAAADAARTEAETIRRMLSAAAAN
jgi:hypothetical protein